MKKISSRMVMGMLLFVSLSIIGAGGADAAPDCGEDSVSVTTSGNSVTARATGIDTGSAWALCIYCDSRSDGGTNLPLGRSISSNDADKSVTATVDSSQCAGSSWHTMVVSGNGCNAARESLGDSVVCDTVKNELPAGSTTGGENEGAGDGAENGGGDGDATHAAYTTGDMTQVSMPNPTGVNSFTELAQAVLSWMLKMAGGVALLMLIYGGIVYITSTGDPKKAEQGKRIVIWTIFGLLVLLFSYSILAVVDEIFAN